MKTEPIDRIEHIIAEIDFLVSHVAPVSFTAFATDAILTRAASYSVQIISEAVRHLPPEWLDKYPRIAWREIKGIGNFTRHEYASLRLRVIWEIATEHAGELRHVIEEIDREHGALTTR
jgi:uncharacterized protein with HEPN domain